MLWAPELSWTASKTLVCFVWAKLLMTSARRLLAVRTATDVDVFSGRNAGTTTTPTTDAVTTTGPNELVVALFVNFNSGPWTPGSGMTERYDFDSNETEEVLQAAAGSTGAKTATNTSSGPMTAEIVVLRGT